MALRRVDEVHAHSREAEERVGGNGCLSVRDAESHGGDAGDDCEAGTAAEGHARHRRYLRSGERRQEQNGPREKSANKSKRDGHDRHTLEARGRYERGGKQEGVDARIEPRSEPARLATSSSERPVDRVRESGESKGCRESYRTEER